MNIVSATRAVLGLSQAEFGIWLGERLGRAPIPQPRIAEWENGVRSPRRNVRRVCAPVISHALATRAVHAVAEVCGAGAGDRLPPELAAVRDELAAAIEALIA